MDKYGIPDQCRLAMTESDCKVGRTMMKEDCKHPTNELLWRIKTIDGTIGGTVVLNRAATSAETLIARADPHCLYRVPALSWLLI